MNNKHMIGIIGGMGPQASIELNRLLIAGARHRYGAKENHEYPEILIDSVPVPDFLSDTGTMEEAAVMLEDRVRRLTTYGASTITMACNTACLLVDRLQKQTHVPFVSVVDEVVREVVRGGNQVLLLASPTSLNLGLYQLRLARFGLPYIVPDQQDFQHLDSIIRGVIEGYDRLKLMKELVKIAERYVAKNNVSAIVLGCTELPLVFPTNYRLPVYSSLSILADCLLKRYYTKEARLTLL